MIRVIFIILACLFVLGQSTIRKRATHDQFLNAHVMSPNDYETFQNFQRDTGLSRETFMLNYLAGITDVARRLPRVRPDLSYKYRVFNTGAPHTFIVGTDMEVTDSIRNGQHRRGNIYQSNAAFKQFNVRGLEDGSYRLNIFGEQMRSRPFLAGTRLDGTKNRNPVHYEANRRRYNF